MNEFMNEWMNDQLIDRTNEQKNKQTNGWFISVVLMYSRSMGSGSLWVPDQSNVFN